MWPVASILLLVTGFTGLAVALTPTNDNPNTQPTPSLPINNPLPTEEPIKITVGKSHAQEEAEIKKEKSRAVAKPLPKKVVIPNTAKHYNSNIQSGVNYCSCVQTVKALTGANIGSVGNAKNWPKNSATPVPGGVVITAESRAGHVAKIKAVEGGYLILEEGNYAHCKFTSGRKLPINSKVIIGFWKA